MGSSPAWRSFGNGDNDDNDDNNGNNDNDDNNGNDDNIDINAQVMYTLLETMLEAGEVKLFSVKM